MTTIHARQDTHVFTLQHPGLLLDMTKLKDKTPQSIVAPNIHISTCLHSPGALTSARHMLETLPRVRSINTS